MMTDHAELTLWLSGLSVFLLLCLLVGLFWYKHHIDRLGAHIGGIPQGDVGALHKIVADQQEMTRQHVTNTFGSLAHETEMNKGLLYGLFGLYDSMVKMLIKIVNPPKDAPKAKLKDDTQ
jgi:hypothetical protein